MQKKAIVIGNSLAVILDKPLCRLLGIQRNTLFSISIDQGAIIIRPIGVTTKAVRGAASVEPSALPPTRARIDLLRSLDALGMTEEHFQRLSFDGKTLGDFAGTVSLGRSVDPVTIERLKECRSRRERCKESWDATIEAVMAVRVREHARVDESASGPHPTVSDPSHIDAA
jgi:hypothetical protein